MKIQINTMKIQIIIIENTNHHHMKNKTHYYEKTKHITMKKQIINIENINHHHMKNKTHYYEKTKHHH
jgi:hypothetical protein